VENASAACRRIERDFRETPSGPEDPGAAEKDPEGPQGVLVIAMERGRAMIPASKAQPAIVRTERGLTVAGTRITLYDVMDCLKARYPPELIRGLFELTEEQIEAALAYIEANRPQVEAEYRQVLEEAEELRRYYEDRNRERMARIALQPPKPGTEEAWKRLRVAKAKREPGV